MARSGSIRGGGLPPQPPSPQRTVYLGRAAQYFDALAGDLGSAMTASSLTEAQLRNHWATHVRPPTHPWLANTEQAVALAAQGKWDRVVGALRHETDYLRRHMPGDLGEARRTTPDLLSRSTGWNVWAAMTERNYFLDLRRFFFVANLMYPDLPDDWLLPTGAAIALTADTTLRLHPQWRRNGARLQHEEQQFLQAMEEGLSHLRFNMAEQLPAIPADYFPALVHDWRQLIFAALGRVVLTPNAFTDDHLEGLFEAPHIPGALWMLAGYIQPESRQYWYRENQQQIREKLAETTSAQLHDGLLMVGAALAESQGVPLDVRWYAAKASGAEHPWTPEDDALVMETLGRIGTACATPQPPLELMQATCYDFDWLAYLPIADDNQRCTGVILLIRLLQLHVCGRFAAENYNADQQGSFRNVRTEALAAVDQLWDDMVRNARSITRDNLPPALALRAAAPLAGGAVVLSLIQIADAAILEPEAKAILATELRAFFQRRGLDDLVELWDMLFTLDV